MATASFDRDDTAQVRAALDAELPRLRAFLRHLLPPADADDVAQDVCLEVLRSPGVLLRGDNPGAYLRGIARHLASRHRRRYPRHQAAEEYLALTWDQVEPEDHAQEQAALKSCMDGLGDRLRQMLDLRYQEGLNATQIGERLSMSAEGVRMALMRGRNALARCLGGRLATQDAERAP